MGGLPWVLYISRQPVFLFPPPAIGYKVDSWTVTPPSTTKFKVEIKAGDHGTPTSSAELIDGKAAKDSVITFLAKPETGYIVDTWTITPSGALQSGGANGSATATVKITADTKVSVSFKKKSYTVRFDANGGTPTPQAQTVLYGDKATAPEAPAKDGSDLEGWFNKAGDTKWDFATNTVTSDTELYAKWKLKKYAVTFSVDGGNGNITAQLDGSNFTGGHVEYGKTVTFTAAPATGYQVDKWTITGSWFEGKRTIIYDSPSATAKITEATMVYVTFKKKSYTVRFDAQGGSPVPPAQTVLYGEKARRPTAPAKDGSDLAGWFNKAGDAKWDFATNTVASDTELYAKWKPKTYAVTFSVDGGNGTLTAQLDDNNFTGGPVELGKTVTFTATPATGCQVDKWTVNPSGALQDAGAAGSATAQVKITEATTVTVRFKAPYTPVNFADLDTYLKNTASGTDVNFIKVTGLTAADLKGNHPFEASPLGKILNANGTKKVALKFGGDIAGLTDMSRCFQFCTSLVQAPVIPESVTNMSSCFRDCTGLTQVPVIPESVTDMRSCFYNCRGLTSAVLKCAYKGVTFSAAFAFCRNLAAGSIKVPAGQLQTYKDHAYTMDAQAEWFAADQ